jgi:hypothetical protein
MFKHTHDTLYPELQTRFRIKVSEKDEGNVAAVSTRASVVHVFASK